jgi:hypothetical protein
MNMLPDYHLHMIFFAQATLLHEESWKQTWIDTFTNDQA